VFFENVQLFHEHDESNLKNIFLKKKEDINRNEPFLQSEVNSAEMMTKNDVEVHLMIHKSFAFLLE